MHPWIDYDLCDQTVWCWVCGQSREVHRWEPVNRFLGTVSAFSKAHGHPGLSREEKRRLEALHKRSVLLP